jgi:2-dehydro-3-deoxyphosphogluconate aldolase/(4S)-4-hydroxy-2-oxoglutarate aldolase
MTAMMDTIRNTGFVPVVALHDAKKAVKLARAMEQGGIPIIEVTYRTAEASDCIRAIHQECPDVIVGAGTVLTVGQVKEAVDCGAMFIVTPGYSDEVVAYCCENQIPVIPGVSNASEIQKGVVAGLKVLKLFPAEPLGGLAAVNFLAAPFPKVKFVPAGGVLMSNLAAYLSNDNIFACAGGFVARANMIEAEDWDGITELCRQAIDTALGFEFAHVGLNCETQENAQSCASFLKNCFGLSGKEGNSSIFVGDKRFELMKKPFHGKNGHIGIFTNSVERALFQLKRRGCKVLEDSIRHDAKGCMQSAYLEGELNGFAVHVVRK